MWWNSWGCWKVIWYSPKRLEVAILAHFSGSDRLNSAPHAMQQNCLPLVSVMSSQTLVCRLGSQDLGARHLSCPGCCLLSLLTVVPGESKGSGQNWAQKQGGPPSNREGTLCPVKGARRRKVQRALLILLVRFCFLLTWYNWEGYSPNAWK